jgi:glycerol uptake facilitator-like aquaporin
MSLDISLDAPKVRRAYLAEALGSLLLSAIVVGSGIMAERLSAGNSAVALLGNTLATAAGLVVLILVFGPLSGAHFNPAISLVMAGRGALPKAQLPGYVLAQVLGMVLGVALAHLMFELPVMQLSQKLRAGSGQLLSEFTATFCLLLTILRVSRHRPELIPFAVAAMVAAGYWFTASTSFANPAITLARSLTDTFAGIAPSNCAGFVFAQVVGALAVWGMDCALEPHAD